MSVLHGHDRCPTTAVGQRPPSSREWRRGRDSNPRWVAPYRISSAAPSATRRPLRGRGLLRPIVSESKGDGGEGGIRTRGAFAHRFSRAAPSTTRTPLRGEHSKGACATRLGDPPVRAPPDSAVRCGPGPVTWRRLPGDRRLPGPGCRDTTRSRPGPLPRSASWSTDPHAPCNGSRQGVHDPVGIRLQQCPETHDAGLHHAEQCHPGERRTAQTSRRLADGVHHRVRGRVTCRRMPGRP